MKREMQLQCCFLKPKDGGFRLLQLIPVMTDRRAFQTLHPELCFRHLTTRSACPLSPVPARLDTWGSRPPRSSERERVGVNPQPDLKVGRQLESTTTFSCARENLTYISPTLGCALSGGGGGAGARGPRAVGKVHRGRVRHGDSILFPWPRRLCGLACCTPFPG